MSDGSSIRIDTSAAVAAVGSLVSSLGTISQSSIVAFAGLQELGSGLESFGQSVVSTVGNVVATASQIQTLQAGLTESTYNFNESLGQNQQQSKAMQSQLMQLATNIKQPTTSVLQLANTVASLGYSGQQIPVMTKAFAEFATVTNTNASVLAPKLSQVMQQFRIPVGDVNSFLSATYAVYKNTSGGAAGVAAMADRLGTLSITAGLSAKQFIALSATAQNVDNRIGRGGAASAIGYVSQQIDKFIGDPGTEGAANFFKFLGTTHDQLAQQWKTNPFGVLDNFLKRFGNVSGPNAQTVLDNIGLSSQATSQGIQELSGTTKDTGKTMDDYLNMANQGWSSGTDVQVAYQATLQTTAANMIGLRDTVTQLSNKIGSDLLPMMNAGAHIAQDFAGAFSHIPGPALAAAAGIIAVGGGAAIAFGFIVKLATVLSGLPAKWGQLKGGLGGISTTGSTAGNAERAGATDASTGATSENSAATSQNTAAISENTAAKQENVAVTGELAAADQGATAGAEELGAAEVVSGAEGEAAGAGIAAAMGPAAIAVAGVTAAFVVLTTEASHASAAGKNAANSFSKQFDTSNIDGLNAAIGETQNKIDSLKKKGEAGSLFGSFVTDLSHFSDFSQSPKSYYQRGAEVKQDQANLNSYKATLQAVQSISQQFFGDVSGDHLNAVLKAATDNAINLATGGQQARNSVLQLLGTADATAQTAQADQAQQAQTALDREAQAAMSVAQETSQLVQEHDQLAEAQIRVGEAARELANLQNMVANAENKVAEANTEVTASQLQYQAAVIAAGEAEREAAIYTQTLANAYVQLNEAQLQVQSSQLALIQAQLDANQAAAKQQLSLAQANLAVQQSELGQQQAANQLADANWNLYKLGADYANQYQQALNNVADTQLSLTSATLSAQNAQWELTYLQQEGASNRDIQIAQLNLAEANQRVTDTQTNLTAAQQQANQMPTDHALAMADAETQLAQAQLGVQNASLQEQQALLNLQTAQTLVANNVAVTQAQINLQQALDKVKQANYGVTQAQLALNNLQDGSLQNKLAQANLNIQQALQKENDAQFGVTQAQLALNNLQDGSVQQAYKSAVDAVNTAEFQLAATTASLNTNMAIAKGGTDSVTIAAANLAQELINSGNPQLAALGRQLQANLGVIGQTIGATNGLTGAANGAAGAYNNLAGAAQNAANWLQQASQQQNDIATVMGVNALGIPTHAAGAYITRPELAIVGEAGPELILPLNDMARSMDLLRQAGIIDRTGLPYNTGTPSALFSQGASIGGGGTTIHNYYLNAVTQPADPQEIVDAFAWRARLVAP